MEWTIERVDLVRTLWAKGWSASQIAYELHCGATKNMVIGKVHRLKLTRQAKARPAAVVALPRVSRKPAAKAKRARPLVPAAAKVVQLPSLKEPAQPRPEGYGCSIVDVTGCCWPVDSSDTLPGGFAFCNGPQCDGSAYCAEHRLESVAAYSRELIRKTTMAALSAYKMKVA